MNCIHRIPIPCASRGVVARAQSQATAHVEAAIASSSGAPKPQSAFLGGSTIIQHKTGSLTLPSGILTSDMMKTLAHSEGHGDGLVSPVRVAYQGVPGAYSESAALKACPGWDPLPCEQFEVAFQVCVHVGGVMLALRIPQDPALRPGTTQALSQWMVERAVLPIENSLGGSIHAVYDLLLRYRLHIVGETTIRVNHCLMALPGTKIDEVTRVMSHPQALAQCDGYLRKLNVVKEARPCLSWPACLPACLPIVAGLPACLSWPACLPACLPAGVPTSPCRPLVQAVDDTAGAAQTIAREKLAGVAAVASARAAELYGLEVLDQGIQDNADNITRFIVLSRDPLVQTAADAGVPFKTSIVFSLKEASSAAARPGRAPMVGRA